MAVNGDVLAIGLSPVEIDQIAAGLAPSRVQPSTVDRALDELDRNRYELLIIDAKSGLDGLMLLQHARTSPRLRTLPVLYLMDRRTEGIETITDFIRGLGIEPVAYSDDLQDVVAAWRHLPGRLVPPQEGPDQEDNAEGERREDADTPPAADPEEQTPESQDAGADEPAEDQEGAGTANEPEAEGGETEISQSANTAAGGPGAIDEPGEPIVRRQSDRSDLPEVLDDRPLLLIADPSERVVESLTAEARSRKIRTVAATSLARAREQLSRERPDIAVLDLALPTSGHDAGLAEGGITLLEDLRRRVPPVPALVLTRRDSFGDRAAAVTRGARGFLQKPMPAAEVLDTIAQLLEPERLYTGKVMVVNDEPIILRGLEAVLESAGVLTASIGADTDDLFRIWDVFERFVPDVLVLDLEAPGMRGIDLCRIVRLDPRWAALPVLFLTPGRDPETVREVFAAGGDDYVSKLHMSPELEEKIAHWLRRAQWYRTMADVDPLTRLANRRGGRQVLERFLGTVRRHGGTMCVAVLDVDNFKQINDTIGHAEGDEVLRQVAERLRRTFQRPTDVIVRWGGEEILIGMQETTKREAIRLLENVLRDLRENPPGGDLGPISFSAGVAQYPTDGADLYELYLAADRAMYEAKKQGKGRVIGATGEES